MKTLAGALSGTLALAAIAGTPAPAHAATSFGFSLGGPGYEFDYGRPYYAPCYRSYYRPYGCYPRYYGYSHYAPRYYRGPRYRYEGRYRYR